MGGINRRSQSGAAFAAGLMLPPVDLKKSASICGVTRSKGLAEDGPLSKFQGGAAGGGYDSVDATLLAGVVGEGGAATAVLVEDDTVAEDADSEA